MQTPTTTVPLNRVQLAARAAYVLRDNDRGAMTVAAPRLYPHQWSWDAAFVAIGLATLAPERALTELETLFAAQWRTGLVPHIVFSDAAPRYMPGPDVWVCRDVNPDAPRQPATSGLVQPAVHALAVRRILDAADAAGPVARKRVVERVRALWPALLAWHRYLVNRRDPDGRGLLAIYHSWESGMDNSPRWDVPYSAVVPDPAAPRPQRSDLDVLDDAAQRPTHREYDRYLWLVRWAREAGYDDARLWSSAPFRVADIFASAIFAAANDVLAEVAEELGQDGADELAGYAARFRAGVVGTADADGFAADVDLRTGTPLRTATVAGFAPLVCGGLDADRHRRLLALFWSPAWCGHPDLACPVPPSTSPDGAGFQPATYWRGPQWPPMTWLLAWGLDRSGETGAAGRLRDAAVRQLTDGTFAEYYHPFTAEPLGSPHQSWTAAVAVDLLAS